MLSAERAHFVASQLLVDSATACTTARLDDDAPTSQCLMPQVGPRTLTLNSLLLPLRNEVMATSAVRPFVEL